MSLLLWPDEMKALVDKSRLGRLLGVDVGKKHIGLAMSDALCRIATPGISLRRGKIHLIADDIYRFIGQENVVGIVFGLPKNTDGSFGANAKSVKDFSVALSEHMNMPCVLWDEGFSTAAAESVLVSSGASIKYKNKKIDAIAASYILQSFLEYCDAVA
jgi:putative Holliday junction resolvase